MSLLGTYGKHLLQIHDFQSISGHSKYIGNFKHDETHETPQINKVVSFWAPRRKNQLKTEERSKTTKENKMWVIGLFGKEIKERQRFNRRHFDS